MSIEEYVYKSPLWRSHSLPYIKSDYIIACYKEELHNIQESKNIKELETIHFIAIFNYSNDTPKEISIQSHSSTITIPIIPVKKVLQYKNCEIIFYNHEYNYDYFLGAHRYLHHLGIHSFFIVMPYLYNSGFKTSHKPDYLHTYRHELSEVFDMLADEESKKSFAARVRALITGNVGYLRIAEYDQYFHPLVHPKQGDIVIDGGVSENVHEQIQITSAVSPSGAVIGFEPDPIGYYKAQEKLESFEYKENYVLTPYGLWHETGKVQFASAGVGSHISTDEGAHVVDINVTTINEIAKQHHLRSVDFIKLDIEGAEENALRGAIRTIAQYSPQMAISIYHKFEDLFSIPLFIKKINKDYKLYIGHHHPALFDTVLYVGLD